MIFWCFLSALFCVMGNWKRKFHFDSLEKLSFLLLLWELLFLASFILDIIIIIIMIIIMRLLSINFSLSYICLFYHRFFANISYHCTMNHIWEFFSLYKKTKSELLCCIYSDSFNEKKKSFRNFLWLQTATFSYSNVVTLPHSLANNIHSEREREREPLIQICHNSINSESKPWLP